MYCGSGAAGGIGPVAPGTAFAAQGTLVGKDSNYDGVITPNEMGFIPGGGANPLPEEDCADCVKTVTTYKTVTVPCTRNQYKTVNIKVPKTVPYTAYRPVTKYREITRQMPKTIYINTTEQVPNTTQEPYTAHKTIYIDQPKTTCTPVTKIITRRIPVVNVIPQNPGPCPPGPDPMPQPIDPNYPINPIVPPINRPGGFTDVAVDGNIQDLANQVKNEALRRLKHQGVDTSAWCKWDAVMAQKQIVSGINYKIKVHVHHNTFVDLMVHVPHSGHVVHHNKIQLMDVRLSKQNMWTL